MPEGPEVRRHADALHQALAGRRIAAITARTKDAKAWLAQNSDTLIGKTIERVRSHGKNLLGEIEGGFFFYSHLMMWGKWQVMAHSSPFDVDRRERARIVVMGGNTALLLSAPIFEIGAGDPYARFENLRALGPDILPCSGAFAAACFLERLLTPMSRDRTIGAALLDQTILAGVGNYLRAEMLFRCRLDPWRRVADLSSDELDLLSRVIPVMARRAYERGGMTVSDKEQARMQADPTLRYPNGSLEWGTRHFVFRRTGLPCLVCGNPIRQKKQVTWLLDDGTEKERILFFCPTCQQTSIPLAPLKRSKPKAPATL